MVSHIFTWLLHEEGPFVGLHPRFEERLKLSSSEDRKAKGSDVLKLNVGGDSAFQTRREWLSTSIANLIDDLKV